MKKYLLGIAAVIVPLVFSAFTTANEKGPNVNYFFEYTGTSYTVSDVTTLSKYTHVPGGSLCTGTAAACVVRVTDAYVDNPNTTPTLKSNVTLSATMNGTKAELSGITNSPTNAFSNEPE